LLRRYNRSQHLPIAASHRRNPPAAGVLLERVVRGSAGMSDSVTITATSTATPGRHLIDIRHNHIVADSTSARGGSGEAPVATELFLASLATCALAVITDQARQRGITAREYRADVSTSIDPGDSTRFEHIAFTFRLPGIAKTAAEELVGEFTKICPIYNTAARTTPVSIAVDVE
jgi:uncharacterized OsmC-like protein